MRQRLISLLRDRRGAVVVEFALVIPVLISISLGAAEVGRYMMMQERLERSATTAADLVARAEIITEDMITDIYAATRNITAPFDLSSDGLVIITSVANTSGSAGVAWQRSGGGELSASSEIGSTGGAPTLPTGFTVRQGDGVVFAEVFLAYEPLLGDLIYDPTTLYASAMFRPRVGPLTAVN